MQEVSTQPTGYEIVVNGEYRARGPQGKISKFFNKKTFILPEIITYRLGNKWEFYMENNQKKKRSVPNVITQNAMHCYKHIIRKYYLPPVLREEHEDFASVRTMYVLKKTRINLTQDQMLRDLDKTPISEMKESELLQFVAMNDINLEIGHYPDLADKRTAVEMALASKNQAKQAVEQEEAFDTNMVEPDGVMIREGRVSSSDGVPTDDEQKISEFL